MPAKSYDSLISFILKHPDKQLFRANF